MTAPKHLSAPQYAMLGQLVALPVGQVMRRDAPDRGPLNIQTAYSLEQRGFATITYDTSRARGRGWGIAATETGRLVFPALWKPLAPAPSSCALVAEVAMRHLLKSVEGL